MPAAEIDTEGGTRSELVALLLEEHRRVEELLEGFEHVPAASRGEAFCEITQTLVQHEVAEEEVVYPSLRRHAADGEQLAEARLAEQHEAERVLADLETLGVDSGVFAEMFRAFRSEVLAHARAEETTVFPALDLYGNPDENVRLVRLYRAAKQVAPTHPHPHLPNTGAVNLVVGPVAAVYDHMRDAVRRLRADA